MTFSEKIKLIRKFTGFTQEKLAQELGVSFVTLNSWVNNRSEPRRKKLLLIDELYLKITGQKIIPDSELKAKKDIIKSKKGKYKNVLKFISSNKNLFQQFILSLTYNTNRIEGSTMSENETADVLFRNLALPNKTFVEHLEAKNHQTALEFLFNHLASSKIIDEELILKLHSILMNGINQDAGLYRRHGVRIIGANIPTANYLKIPELMADIIDKINQKSKDTLNQISLVHSQFERIHPFSDGNGRIGRLIIHAMLLKENIPPAIIHQEGKKLYYAYLNKAQKDNDTSLLEDYMSDAVLEGFDMLEG